MSGRHNRAIIVIDGEHMTTFEGERHTGIPSRILYARWKAGLRGPDLVAYENQDGSLSPSVLEAGRRTATSSKAFCKFIRGRREA